MKYAEWRDPVVRSLTLALFLLAGEGFALGLSVGFVAVGPYLPLFVTTNELPAHSRVLLLMVSSASTVIFAAAGVYGVWRRGSRSVPGLYRWTLRMTPLLLFPIVSLLLSRWVWHGRDLLFLALLSLFALSALALFRTAFSQPPLMIPRAGGKLREPLDRVCQLVQEAGPALPFSLVVLGALGYAGFFSYHTIAYHRNLYSTSFDLAIFDNLMWNLVHGGPFFKSAPELGPQGSHFGIHANLLAYLLAPVYAIAPRAETLLTIQASLLGGAAIPLYLFASRHVARWQACLLAYCYLLYPPLHGANLYDFHFLKLSPFFIWLCAYLFESRRDWLAAVVAVLALTVREDVAVGMVVVGVYLLVAVERPRAGLVLAAVSAAWLASMRFWLMPMMGIGRSFVERYRDLLPAQESGIADLVLTVLTNPALTLSTMLTLDKLIYVLQIMAPLAFLPLFRPIGLLLVIPGVVFTLLSTGYAPLVQISFQYTAHWTPFVFVAATLGLAYRQGKPVKPGHLAGAQRKGDLLVLALVTLLSSYQYGAILQQETARGGFRNYVFGTNSEDMIRRLVLRDLLRQLPPEAKVVATERLVPQVANRADAYTLRVGTFDAEYLLFAVEPPVLLVGEDTRALRLALSSGEFGVIALREPFGLARRGASTLDNREVLQRLPD